MFFSAAVRGRAALSDARTALTDVPALDRSDGARVGDPAPVPADVTDWTRPMVEDRFGAGFAASVFECDTGTWSGPFASAYGVHLVFVSRRSAERTPDFAEVADRIATDMETTRRSGALDRIYAGVRDGYEVEIEPAAPAGASPAIHGHSHDDVHSHEERTRA